MRLAVITETPCGIVIETPDSKLENRDSKVENGIREQALVTPKPKSKANHQLGYDQAQQAARYLKTSARSHPGVGIILGSGLGGVARSLEDAKRIPYRRIPHFPRSTVVGHAG